MNPAKFSVIPIHDPVSKDSYIAIRMLDLATDEEVINVLPLEDAEKLMQAIAVALDKFKMAQLN